jgi:hypothetical protein
MDSQRTSTRIQQPPPPPSAARKSDLELSTLVISAIASASAAFVISKIWAPGTLTAAAMTPVIVALVKEGLRRPSQVVTAVVPTPVRAVRRRAGTQHAREVEAIAGDVHERLDAGAPPPFPPPAPGAEAPVRVYSTRGRRLRWRLALVTGILGFAICAVLYTVPELIAGQSVGSSGRGTTLWGGKRRAAPSHSTTTSTTTTSTTSSTTTTSGRTQTQPVQTVTQTVTTQAPPAASTPGQTSTPSSSTPPSPQGATPGGSAPQATP